MTRSRRASGFVLAALLALAPLGADELAPRADELAPGATLRAARPLAPEAPAPEKLAPAEYGMAMPWGEARFEAFRCAYQTVDGRHWLEAIMARAEPYLPWIAERLRHYNLPDELMFLPVIESEYSPKAVSKSGAMGLWQFMRNSIGGYGIRIDDWLDERRDFMKSTDAALRKLRDNYMAFGDWDLALAAYNAGYGAVSRAIKKAQGLEGSPADIDYWYLKSKGLLPRETGDYVPKFLAVASILRYPLRNGLALSWKEPASWEAVQLGRSVDLGLLAEAAGIGLAELKKANAELKYNVTPPSASYAIKVPEASAEAVKAALDNPDLKLLRYYLHKVSSGDTLSAIARYYGTPMKMVEDANPGLKPNLLKLGQVIVIPALKDSLGPMPSAASNSEDLKLDFSGAYTVAKGDSLWSISLRYEVQPEVLADKNSLTLTSVIREGMVLKVPILKQ